MRVHRRGFLNAVGGMAGGVALPASSAGEAALADGPGGRTTGDLKVLDGVDLGTSIPITVIRGARPGPVLALNAGVHGSECTPILALLTLPAKLDPEAMAGTVLVVHVANPALFTTTDDLDQFVQALRPVLRSAKDKT